MYKLYKSLFGHCSFLTGLVVNEIWNFGFCLTILVFPKVSNISVLKSILCITDKLPKFKLNFRYPRYLLTPTTKEKMILKYRLLKCSHCCWCTVHLYCRISILYGSSCKLDVDKLHRIQSQRNTLVWWVGSKGYYYFSRTRHKLLGKCLSVFLKTNYK